MPKILIITMLLLTNLPADNRSFVWTYEAQTMEAGEAEFEHYYTVNYTDGTNLDRDYALTHNFELEIGMTNTFDVGIYQQFSQTKSTGLVYDKFKIRFRYRLAPGLAFGADPLLYLEYQSNPSFASQVIEGKLVIAKEWKALIWAINPGLEWNIRSRTAEPFYTAGAAIRISQLVKLGIEMKGNGAAQYIGPVISHGNDKRYIALGSGIRIMGNVSGKPEFMIRSIIGIQL